MSEPLRILHVFSTFKVGGAQMRFVELAKGLGSSFSHIVIARDGDYTAARHLSPGVNVTLVDPPFENGSLVQRLSRYRQAIAAQAPDLLVTYNWGTIEWAMANIFLGTPHIQIEDGFGPEEAHRQLRRRVWTRRLVLRRSHVIVPSAVLEDLALNVWRLAPAQVHFIVNGIAPQDRFTTQIDSLGLDLPPNLPRIAWAGALRREKNLVRLLEAFAPLKQEAVLLILGDGTERDIVLREAENLSLGASIRLLGRREDVRDILMQCDIVALSSDTEQMPLVVLEGMDAGLPIASTDVGDVRQMVCRENQPYIVDNSAAALSAALRALVANAAARQTIGAANRQRLRENYHSAGMVAAYEKLFRARAARRN